MTVEQRCRRERHRMRRKYPPVAWRYAGLDGVTREICELCAKEVVQMARRGLPLGTLEPLEQAAGVAP